MDRLKNIYKTRHPEAKPHKVEAAVFRMTYTHKLK